MTSQTLVDVFDECDQKGMAGRLFSATDIEKTADLAQAETVQNTRDLVEALLGPALDQLLDIRVIDIVLGAWKKMSAIQAFATDEHLRSKKTHKFTLTEHKVRSNHSPKIELFVYDKKVTELPVDITLTFVIAKTYLMIKHGRIVEVRIGGCQVSGTIGCLGQTFYEKTSTEMDFPPKLKLGDGIVIPPPLKRKASSDTSGKSH
jgi:hypothetical protein